MSLKCPICFSDIGTPSPIDFIWTEDPILTTPFLISGTPYLNYTGFTKIKAQHIKELQDNRKQLETDLGLTLSVFSPIDIINFYKNMERYIYELRISTENILIELGLTKEEYFNYDKDGNDMRPGNHQLDWTDIPFPTYQLSQYQSKAAHIEDLRHYIQTLWKETWEKSINGIYYRYDSIIGLNQIWSVGGAYSLPSTFVEIYDASTYDKKLRITTVGSDLGINRFVMANISSQNVLKSTTNLFFDITGTITGSGSNSISLLINVQLKAIHPFWGDNVSIAYIVSNTSGHTPPYPSIILTGSSPYTRNIYSDINFIYGVLIANDIDKLNLVSIENSSYPIGNLVISESGDIKLK